MSTVYVDCQECAGRGWKNCPMCPGTGKVRCSTQCDEGKLPCPDGCNAGYSRTLACPYCADKDTCTSCEKRGFLRCVKCNPYTHGFETLSNPGTIRCPSKCDAGYFPCPVCMIYNLGAGRIGCEDCGNEGRIAVTQDDPPLA